MQRLCWSRTGAESDDMKRNMELVRQILLACEEDPTPGLERQVEQKVRSRMKSSEVDSVHVHGHLKLLIEAELVDGGNPVRTFQGETWVGSFELTWKGHDFLADIRDDSRWAAFRAKIGSRLDTLSFDVLEEAVKEFARARSRICCNDRTPAGSAE